MLMICQAHDAPESFGRTVSRCLPDERATNHPRRWGGLHPVAWTETRRYSTAAPERPLDQPAFHYTLYWPHAVRPGEIRRAVTDSLTDLGLDEHQAVLVGRDGPVPHVDVIVNRVSPTDGRAVRGASLALTLHRWQQRWERRHELIPHIPRAPVHRTTTPPPPPGAA